MSAFPFLHPTFLLDSDFLPNISIPNYKMSGLMEETHDIIINNNSFYSYHPSDHHQFHDHQGMMMMTSSVGSPFSHEENNEQSHHLSDQKYKTATDSSSMVIHDDDDDEQEIHKKINTTEKKRKKNKDGGSCVVSSQSKETKPKRQRKWNGGLNETEEQKKSSKAEKKNNQKAVPHEPPTGYIHVRARRGQATDSHSLAERVRREKISERMKLLQGLVPGCDKVTGKALMLDEIINYVQSLQNQVEFLSMKLASVNPMFHDFGAADLDALMVKPEKMSNLVSPLQSSSTPAAQLTAFADTTTTFSTSNNYPTLEFQQGQRSNAFSHSHQVIENNLLMDVDEQRQMFMNQSWFNHLCSFQ